MPIHKDTSPNIKWPLAEGVPAFSVENFFPDDILQEIKTTISAQVQWGPGSENTNNSKYHTITGRWVADANFSSKVWTFLEEAGRAKWGKKDLKLKVVWLARYQQYKGVTPYLWEHMDQPATQYMMDICIESPGVNWSVLIDGEEFKEKENSAVFFMGQQQSHSRPPYPVDDSNAYVIVMFGHFVDSTHWFYDLDAYSDEDALIVEQTMKKYKLDGDIRYYEYSGHAPRFDNLPPGNYPCDGGECTQCHVVSEDFVKHIDGYIELNDR